MTLRAFIFLLATFVVHAAPLKNVVKPEPNKRFKDLVHAADRCLISTAGLHANDIKNQRHLVELSGITEVERFAALFSFTGEYTSAFPTTRDGEQVLVIANCLCTGSHMISFVRDGTEVVAMSLHHWSHVRPARGWKSQDVNLTKEASDRIRAFLLNPDATQTANKAPEPTTTSVMPAAEQPSRRP